MIAYIGRRLSILFLILFGSSFLVYNLVAYSGDPTEGLRGNTDPKAIQALHALIRNLQLDVPPPARYFLWLKKVVLNFDFGTTREGLSVASDLRTAIPTTIRLILMSTIIAIVIGIAFGIISALRQYTRFDYAMTFIAFVLFSLPVFWVAVLLKQFLAVSFNNFLANGQIAIWWIVVASLVSGLFWATIISGSRKRVWQVFAIAAVGSAISLELLSATHWFKHPTLGPVAVGIIGVGIAYGVTYLSVGLQNKQALKSSLTMVAASLVLYFPTQWVLNKEAGVFPTLGLLVLTITIAVVSGIFFSKIDRGPIVRTTVITSFLIGLVIIIDKLMKVWVPYINTDAVNGRPIPTISENNSLLPTGNFWFGALDTVLHLMLPTLALSMISFAGYVRYSRGTLLEVLNQDYIRTARAKGLTERTVVMRHAFRNTLIPLTTIVVVDFAGIIGGAIITESVFGWRGMGTLFNQAIRGQDLNLFMGVFLVTATLTVLANLVADLLYSALDPRVRVVAG